MTELFSGFLENAELYERVEAYWATLATRAVGELQDVIHPWLKTRFNNGTRFSQGDPIYSIYLPAANRAVRIDQVPAGRARNLVASFDTFDDEPRVQVLHLECTLTPSTGPAVAELISAWLVERKSKSRVQELADRLAAQAPRTKRRSPAAHSSEAVHVSGAALDFALAHVLRVGGSTFFPKAFEFSALEHTWPSFRKELRGLDLGRHTPSGQRSYLAPRKTYGLRVATELSPIDTVLYTALCWELGEAAERVRAGKEHRVVHSFRFDPGEDGELWDRSSSFATFDDETRERLTAPGTSYVAATDITDFYHQLRPESVRRALARAEPKAKHERLDAIVRFAFGSVESGLPVGPAASSLFAELAIADVDDYLLAHKANYVRFNDDFRFFAPDEGTARNALSLLADYLWRAHGLRLKAEKTVIKRAEDFSREHYFKSPRSEAVDDLLDELEAIVGGYEPVEFTALAPEQQELVLKVGELIQAALDKSHVAYISRVARVLRNLRISGRPDLFAPVIDEAGRLIPLVKLISRTVGRVAAAKADDRSYFRDKVLNLMHRATSTPMLPLDYEMTWLSSFFTGPHWGEISALKDIAERMPASYVAQREVVLALRHPDAGRLNAEDPWHRRARIAVGQPPGPRRTVDLQGALDEAVFTWAQSDTSRPPLSGNGRAKRSV